MYIPLNKNTIGNDERRALLKVFDSKYMTMGTVTKKFEAEFAKYLGEKCYLCKFRFISKSISPAIMIMMY